MDAKTVLRKVLRYYSIDFYEICTEARSLELNKARNFYFQLCKEFVYVKYDYTGQYSLKAIGEAINRPHCTVLSNWKLFKKKAKNEAYLMEYEELKEIFN